MKIQVLGREIKNQHVAAKFQNSQQNNEINYGDE